MSADAVGSQGKYQARSDTAEQRTLKLKPRYCPSAFCLLPSDLPCAEVAHAGENGHGEGADVRLEPSGQLPSAARGREPGRGAVGRTVLDRERAFHVRRPLFVRRDGGVL